MPRNFPMVSRIISGRGCFEQLDEILAGVRAERQGSICFLVDDVFKGHALAERIPIRDEDDLLWLDVTDEPKTSDVDGLTARIRERSGGHPAGIIGIGGGSAMDLAKAVGIMLNNEGSSTDNQGWDLVKNPAVYKAGIPTLSGTGAEVSRTAVLCGPEKKLGINSDYTVFDQIVLDADLIEGAPNPQRFYTGMDCYIHCVESLTGTFLTPFSRAYGEKAMELCRDVFLNEHRGESDDLLMVASYCGGMSIANSQVGVCHALSYGLSFVLGTHHGIGNCIVFDHLDEFYADGVEEFRRMMQKHRIELPVGLTKGLTEDQMETMVKVALGLGPLWENALGPDWKAKMPPARVRELYSKM
jgi:3-deoxy-alpha-D-manno-octulosonate 8-oxidase